MGTYAWNIFYSKILPAKSHARCCRPAAAGPPSQTNHWNVATGPYMNQNESESSFYGLSCLNASHLQTLLFSYSNDMYLRVLFLRVWSLSSSVSDVVLRLAALDVLAMDWLVKSLLVDISVVPPGSGDIVVSRMCTVISGGVGVEVESLEVLPVKKQKRQN